MVDVLGHLWLLEHLWLTCRTFVVLGTFAGAMLGHLW